MVVMTLLTPQVFNFSKNFIKIQFFFKKKINFNKFLYNTELGNLAHQGLASYDIKLNTKYTNIIRAMNGLEKEEKTATVVLTTKSLNNSDEEKNSLKRPSFFKKK